MSSSWASQFRQFALAVDFVDDIIVNDIKALLRRYFEETLETCHFRFLMRGTGTETPDGLLPTLETVWSSNDEISGDVALYTRDGRSSGHVALAYELRKPMWITAKDGGALDRENVELVDNWSHVSNLPSYTDYGDSGARTSIVVPLTYGDGLFGVMDLEFKHYVPATTRGKSVVKMIEDATSRIIWLNRMTRTQRNDTREAFSTLERSYRKGPSPLENHTVFVASSGRADQQVMEIMLRVLGEFKGTFEINYWKADSSAGNIAEQVRTAIAEAEFGVCYISERSDDPDSKYRFLDNPNVLFEAGMLQMLHELRDDHSGSISRWIPVREAMQLSPPLPFDFAGDRVVTVPRKDDTGPLDEAAFEEKLRTTIREVVDDLDIS